MNWTKNYKKIQKSGYRYITKNVDKNYKNKTKIQPTFTKMDKKWTMFPNKWTKQIKKNGIKLDIEQCQLSDSYIRASF